MPPAFHRWPELILHRVLQFCAEDDGDLSEKLELELAAGLRSKPTMFSPNFKVFARLRETSRWLRDAIGEGAFVVPGRPLKSTTDIARALAIGPNWAWLVKGTSCCLAASNKCTGNMRVDLGVVSAVLALDVRLFSHVHSLSLTRRGTSPLMVDCLAGMHTLDLRGSRGVEDVSALGNVHTLILRDCRRITDVSALGKVHHLDLSGCDQITDVSALSGCHTLILRCCTGVQDVSKLGSVHTLSLRYCPNVADVSALGAVYDLDLRGCRQVVDISALGNVHTLNLSCCYAVRDVSALTSVVHLNLSCCGGFADVGSLGRCDTLLLRECENVRDVSKLGSVRVLDLHGCISVSDVSALGRVHSLDISGCYLIEDVAALSRVHTLNIAGCPLIEDLTSLISVPNLLGAGQDLPGPLGAACGSLFSFSSSTADSEATAAARFVAAPVSMIAFDKPLWRPTAPFLLRDARGSLLHSFC